MKTGAEGINVILGWYTNGVKWLLDSRVQDILTKKRNRRVKEEQNGVKKKQKLFHFPVVQSIKKIFHVCLR